MRAAGSTAAAYAVCLLVLGAWVLYAGQDLSWDVLNHHVYLPYSLVSGRFATDLFAAGPQSTQHPLGYLPFWGLLVAGLPAWAVGAALTAWHASLVLPLLRIAGALWPGSDVPSRQWRVLACILALVAPSFLLVVGTSSTDALMTPLLLLAFAWAMPGSRTAGRAVGAGVLLGLAVVVKPSNVVLALAIGAAWSCRAFQLRWFVAGTGAALLTVTLLQGPWSWWLWHEWGNPLFPLFNATFRSPFAPLEPMVDLRFLPTSALDVLLRPLELAKPQRLTHSEVLAPDLRPLAGIAGLALLGIAMPVRRWRSRMPSAVPSADRELLVFAAVGTPLWLLTSGNSRYALALFLVIGLVAVRAFERALPARLARAAVLLILVLQVGYTWELGSRRLEGSSSWGVGPYIGADIPRRLRDEPMLHLALSTPSFAALAPQLHAQGVFVQAVGTMSLPSDGPLGVRLQQRLQAWQGRTRILFMGNPPLGQSEAAARARADLDRLVYRFGLQVDWRDCEPLGLRTGRGPESKRLALSSCATNPRASEDPSYAAELARAETVFALVEAQCPRIFGPRPMATNAGQGSWHRHYINSDTRVMIVPSEGVFMSHFAAFGTRRLASVEDVLAGRLTGVCDAWRSFTAP